MNTNDPIELIVADGLTRAGIAFTHESDNKAQALDFWLHDLESDIFIECKQFPSERTGLQIALIPNVIVIQGRAAAHAFAKMIAKESAPQAGASHNSGERELGEIQASGGAGTVSANDRSTS